MSKATNEQKGWYEAIKPLKTTFTGGGTHVNVSAAAIAKNAPNKDSAVKLIEYMLGEKAQTLYADGNFEYPVNADVKEAAAVKLLGALTPDTTPLGDVAKNRKAASELVDKVGFDN
jgi:iron(III) transport system substrate-binding protein